MEICRLYRLLFCHSLLHYFTLLITSANEVVEVMFSPLFLYLFVYLSVCEQLPNHNFSHRAMKPAGIIQYAKIWNSLNFGGDGTITV